MWAMTFAGVRWLSMRLLAAQMRGAVHRGPPGIDCYSSTGYPSVRSPGYTTVEDDLFHCKHKQNAYISA